MTPNEYEHLHEQTKRFYCDEHYVPKVKTAMGNFACLFCELDE